MAKDMNDGPSFLNKLKEKVGAKLQDKLGQLGQAFSNGTGSDRPNFEQGAQNVIGNIRGGQRMGEMLKFGKRNSQKLDEVLKAVQKNNSGNAPQADFTRMASQQSAGMPPADPMAGKQTSDIPTTPGSIPEGSNIDAANAAMMEMDMGATMAAKPKQVAKAKAKAYADKKGIRGKARKELVKDAKRSQSFDTKAQDEKSGDKAVEFGGSMHIDPPKAKTMKRDGTKVLSNQVKFPSYFKKLSQGMIAEGAAEGIANAGDKINEKEVFNEMLGGTPNAGKMAYSRKMEKLKPIAKDVKQGPSAKIGAKRKVKKAVKAGNYSTSNAPGFKELPDDGYSSESKRQLLKEADAYRKKEKAYKEKYKNQMRYNKPLKPTL